LSKGIKNNLQRTTNYEVIEMDSLEKIFGKTAQMTVLENLIKNKNEITYLSGIAEETGLSHASVSRVITPLIGSGIVKEKPFGKQTRIFQLNMENEATRMIIDFYNEINHIEAEA
jgi:DNA-binding MarR family transcriptional regulator